MIAELNLSVFSISYRIDRRQRSFVPGTRRIPVLAINTVIIYSSSSSSIIIIIIISTICTTIITVVTRVTRPDPGTSH